MKSLATITIGLFALLLVITAPIALSQSSSRLTKADSAFEKDKTELLVVIERQSAAFWAKDFQRWADTWVHAPYIRRLGWSEAEGVSSMEGWEAIGAWMKKNMSDNPKPNPTPAKLARDHFNFRIHRDIAWVTFEQHGVATGETRFDMPGLSYETRMFERDNGKWKVVYLNYLLAGPTERKAAK